MATYEWRTHDASLDGSEDHYWGNRINDVPTITISSISFYVKKVGSPTGSCYARIRLASAGMTILKTLGSVQDIAAISTSYGWLTFTESYTLPSINDYRFTLDFVSGSGSWPNDWIDVRQNLSHALGSNFLKTGTINASTWSDSAPYIVTFIINFTYGSTYATITTQACTDTIAEFSTAHGNLVSGGGSAVTQHGHCWATTTTPTTSDNKTTLGAKPNLGQFTSSMTGLTPSTKYYVRAYATNTTGTTYGNEVDTTSTGTIGSREIWEEATAFHYIDQYGTERQVIGTTITGASPYVWLPFM